MVINKWENEPLNEKIKLEIIEEVKKFKYLS